MSVAIPGESVATAPAEFDGFSLDVYAMHRESDKSVTETPSRPTCCSPSAGPSSTTEAQVELTGVVNRIRSGAGRVVIEGHTDAIGDDGANQVLSERRAEAVRDNPSGRQQNRRVTVVLVP
jgi:hypothetical protein